MSQAFSPSPCMDLVWSDWGTSWLDPWATSFSVGKLSRLSNCHQHSACPPASTFFWWCWTGNGRVNSLTCWATSSFRTLCFAQRLRQAMLPSLTTKVPRLRMCFTILFLLDATSLSGDSLLDMTQLEWILEFLITSSNPKITSGINNNVCNHICKKSVFHRLIQVLKTSTVSTLYCLTYVSYQYPALSTKSYTRPSPAHSLACRRGTSVAPVACRLGTSGASVACRRGASVASAEVHHHAYHDVAMIS